MLTRRDPQKKGLLWRFGLTRRLWGSLDPMFSYLDAASGSMIITAIAGGFAGLGVAIKMGAARFKSKVTGKPVPEFESSDEDDSASSHD